MAKHIVKCAVCKKEFALNESQGVKYNARRYAHQECFPQGELVPMDDPSVSLIVCNSNKKHKLTGSEYPDRVNQCKEALSILSSKYPEVKALRDATVEQVESMKEEMNEIVYRRALHVVFFIIVVAP